MKEGYVPGRHPPLDDNLFQFSRQERKELLNLLGGLEPIEAHERLLGALTWMIHGFRNLNSRGNKFAPPGLRAEIAALLPNLKNVASAFERDALSLEAWDLLDQELQPILSQWLINPYEIPEIHFQDPSPLHGYQKALHQALVDIYRAVERASSVPPSEIKGGRPKASAKRKMVAMAVDFYFAYLKQMPPTTKEGDFEQVIRRCLIAAGYVPGNVHQLIVDACKAAKAKQVLKPPS